MPAALEDLTFHNGSIQLHAVAAGSPSAPLVILLHGFPEFWYSWRHQLEPLSSAGFRVIVPDQRGYNLSSKPPSAADYKISLLVPDVLAIADQLNAPRFFLAGHDWGAAVAWATAILHPQRVSRLAILNVPHPSVMLRFLKTNPRQFRRSWYVFFFQLPWLPEAAFSAFNFRLGVRSLVSSSRPGTFTEDDLALYRAAWSQPHALTSMINWYRAALRSRDKFPDPRVRVPTRILWGERDAFLLSEMAHASLSYCDSAELYTFSDASHWLQHEEPSRVSQHLIDFFRS
ncbi:MAG TPA: alpha/beta hydrolase [Candidatus Acidoferrum sp.]|nr:alpha/beta hydrolase [Candidatus Acidoferrum sp.]